jgi:hypothetical protein
MTFGGKGISASAVTFPLHESCADERVDGLLWHRAESKVAAVAEGMGCLQVCWNGRSTVTYGYREMVGN